MPVVQSAQPSRNLNDEAFLALIKNDQKAFEAFIAAGGDLQGMLPAIDGKTYTVAQGLAYFERTNFIKYLQDKKISFLKQSTDGSEDILSMAISKNNPELFALLLKENPNMNATYGKANSSLIHMASANCSNKLMDLLHQKGSAAWDAKDKHGNSALAIASKNDCLPMLSFWKDHKADFKKKDGTGASALSILKGKKDAASTAFVQSFETDRKPASVAKAEVNFYRKRQIPKDQLVDHSALLEPELRPDEALETAENSEFSD